MKVDRISVAATMLAVLTPDQWLTTILLSQRFGPIGLALLLLGLPKPPTPGRIADGFPLVTVSLWAFLVTGAFIVFDRIECSGLSNALRAQHGPARVLGLAFDPPSQLIMGSPWLQTFAFTTALHGGETNFSFAEHGTTLVSYRRPRRVTWTPGLEWMPTSVRPRDIRQFDYALVTASEQNHQTFRGSTGARPVTRSGNSRLYDLRTPSRAP